MTTRTKQPTEINDLFAYRETVKPSFASQSEVDSAFNRFYEQYGVPTARKLIALGYGPLGERDQNFNPTFRRRYYLTQEDLEKEFKFLCESFDVIFRDDIKERTDNFFLDARWFLKNRADIHEGSVPSDSRKGR